ncbi:MAG: hypothetical protein WCQ64_04315 [Acidobacteriota bacterium]
MIRFRALAPAVAAVALTASLLTLPAVVLAQTKPVAPALPSAPAAPSVVVEGRDATETRQALMEVLRHYPPSLGQMLKQDPGLMSNQQYMSAYPALVQFLQQHPDVSRSPYFFFQSVRDSVSSNWLNTEEGRAQQSITAWRNIIQGFTFLLGFLSVVAGITWIVRSLIEHRRWSRLSKVQAEVHNKLIDRLASNDEMLAYIQSPAGAGFLKAGPIDVGTGAKSMHAPFGRILWSAQAGVVLLALGLGLRWVTVSAPNEVVEMLHFFGIIGQALGLGFMVSAGLSYVLSRRMGLIDAAHAARMERDTASRS